jgi:4-hydroxy-tetrahydrodipicolinate reductase
MKAAIIGYGKMGKTIESLGKKQGFEFPLIIDMDNPEDLHPDRLKEVDAAIEFTTPDSAPGNILACLEHGVPVVSGTTGWNERFDEIAAFCKQKNGTLLYASNFNIGVNILFAINRYLAKIMNRFPQYNAFIKEVHHIHKADAPSGTAITLADQIIRENEQIRRWSLKGNEGEATRPIEAVREGEVKGRHTIRYESELDSITLSHDAKSRDAFAEGALLALSFIRGKKGLFSMEDLLKL